MWSQLDKKEKRHFIRHPMCFPLKFQVIHRRIGHRSDAGNSVTVNIGRGGLLFSAQRPVVQDALIRITIPFQEKIFKVNGRVVYCRKNSETELYNVGVCFQHTSEAFRVRLIEQLYLISEYRDLRSIQLGRNISLKEASREWVQQYSQRFQKLYW